MNRIGALFALGVLLAIPLAGQAPVPAWTIAGTVDAGFVSATGNTDVTTITLGNKIGASRGHWTLRQSAAYVYGKSRGVESANQLRAGTRAEYALSNRFSGFAAVVYERNAFAGFDRRIDEQLGVQWRPISTAADSLILDAGDLLTQQENTDGTSERSPSARAALGFKHMFKASTFLTQNLEYVLNLQEEGAYRLNAETAAVAPLSTRISMKVGYVLQYNSRPPSAFGTTDRVLTSGLQVSF